MPGALRAVACTNLPRTSSRASQQTSRRLRARNDTSRKCCPIGNSEFNGQKKGNYYFHAFRDGHRTTPSNHAIAVIRASGWLGRRRYSVRAGHPEFHALAPLGEIEE